MTTLIIEDSSPQAKKLIAYIRTLPFVKVKTEKAALEIKNPFAESDDDMKNGRVYSATNADDLIEKCLQ